MELFCVILDTYIKDMAFSAFIDYLQLEKNYSLHTVRAYKNDLKNFERFICEEFEESDMRKVNYSMIRSWIVHLVDQKLTKRTVNRKMSSLQAYFTFLLKAQQIERSPMAKHKFLKTAKKIQVPFS